jgi:acyl carrier protein
MTAGDVISRTRDFLVENFLYMRKDFTFTDSDSLMKRGVIDSMGVVELVDFVQSEFGVTVDNADITEENFGTLESIGRYVASRAAA